jgi:hypothetical protein
MSTIDLKLKEIDRNWTKEQYKAIDTWRRQCRRVFNKSLEKIDAGSLVTEAMIYGSAVGQITYDS